MRTRIAAAVALFAAGALLTGCAARLGAGTVIEKKYTAAWCTTYFAFYDGKTPTPVLQCYPDSWELQLRDGDEEGVRAVTAAEFGSYEIGDDYPKAAR